VLFWRSNRSKIHKYVVSEAREWSGGSLERFTWRIDSRVKGRVAGDLDSLSAIIELDILQHGDKQVVQFELSADQVQQLAAQLKAIHTSIAKLSENK
jgi:hypothetical protein